MESKSIKIHFLGAAGTVTGSKYLVETIDRKILIDCGLFQGLKELRLKNWETNPIDSSSIDMVLLTHGHLDHTGYLPRLVKQGFKGFICGTNPTLHIAEIILKDSAKIQQQEAERANEEGYTKHNPAEPLYDLKDVDRTLPLFRRVPQAQWIDLFEGIKVRFKYNGHILGATFIELDLHGKRLVFSGDIGRTNDLLLFPPLKPKKADILIVESTYGGSLHPSEVKSIPQIEKLVKETIERGGSLFIPTYAVERAQLMMYILWQLSKENRIPKVQMILDSPMGADVLELFYRTKDWHKLSEQDCNEMCSYFTIVSSYAETLHLRKDDSPKIVIAGSGMLTGGRILNYLEVQAQNPKNTLLILGYQAEGTRGRDLLEGQKEIKIYGQWVNVNMEIVEVKGLSAHADHDELINWMSELKNQPERIFIVHGENESAKALQLGIKGNFGWEAEIPTLNQIETIEM